VRYVICEVTGKRGYFDRKSARQTRRATLQGDGERTSDMKIYKCQHCDLLHLGHVDYTYSRLLTADELAAMLVACAIEFLTPDRGELVVDNPAAEQIEQIRAVLDNYWKAWPKWQTGLQSACRDQFLLGVLEAVSKIAFGESEEKLPIGLCGNREDHDPHRHESTSLGVFWCSADQTTRLPFAAGQRKQQKESN